MDGYGIVVIMSCFLLHFTLFGTLQSFGVIFTELLDYFDISKSEASLISSIQVGVMYIIGPIVGIIEKRFGLKVLNIAGSLLATTGFVLSSLVSNVQHLYITYGIFIGVGLSFVNLGSTVPVNTYFTKHRVMAYGATSTGVCIGTLACPLLIRYFIKNYGWRGAFLLMGGIQLQGVIAGFAIRNQPRQYNNVKNNGNDDKMYQEKDSDETDKFIELGQTPDDNHGEINTIELLKNKDNYHSEGIKMIIRHQINSLIMSTRKWYREAWQLFHRKCYVIFLIGNIVHGLVFFVPYILIPDLARTKGISEDNAAFLITLTGISGIFGRIVCGFAFALGSRKILLLNAVFLVAITGFSFWCTVITSYNIFIVYAVIWGAIYNAYAMLITTAFFDVAGKRLYVTGVSLQYVFGGIVSSIGPPIAGYIADRTGSYSGSFYYAGGMSALSSVFMCLCAMFLKEEKEDDKSPKSEKPLQELKNKELMA